MVVGVIVLFSDLGENGFGLLLVCNRESQCNELAAFVFIYSL